MLGIYDVPKKDQRYKIYEPLHRMWVGYMWEILGLKDRQNAYVTAEGAGPKLASADYHGAELEVVRSRCVGRVGCKGIVIKDTKFTFEMITERNVLRSMMFLNWIVVSSNHHWGSCTKKALSLSIQSPTSKSRRVMWTK